MELRLSVAVQSARTWPDTLRALVGEGITMWEADLDEAGVALRRRATPTDLAAARRIDCRRERARWLTGRLLAREVLAWSGIDARRNGRQGPLRYSASRNGSRWLLALGPCALGVEIERVDAGCADAHARQLFTARELRVWQRRQSAGRERMYFATWTAKEAIAKAIGRAAAIPPSAIELPPFARYWRRLPAYAWWLRQLRVDDDCAAALCAGEPLRMLARVRLRGGDDGATA
jgi:phosphopantetheinyl transferase